MHRFLARCLKNEKEYMYALSINKERIIKDEQTDSFN